MTYQSPASSGAYGKDCVTGRQFADDTVAMMDEKEAPFILGYI
ncbi:hypothetical protein [Roseinatronobacter sp. S2]|nr:hypothetical protein [Roseinatronobacter sp. S2]WFE73368.1 hypothetical protein P8S53_09220 [Roseinatronobacter sp. S2]